MPKIVALTRVFIVLDQDDQKMLTVHMTNPVSHGTITGKKVQIIFSSEHDIQTALTRVFKEMLQTAPVNTYGINTSWSSLHFPLSYCLFLISFFLFVLRRQ